MTTGFAGIDVARNENVRKAIKGGVFISPSTSALITKATLFDSTTGALKNPLPTGWRGLGRLSAKGAAFARALKTTDTTGWGTNDPVRTDVDSDVTTLVIEPEETNQQTAALYWGVAASSITPDATNGSIQIDRPDIPNQSSFRILVIAVDETPYGEFVIARFLPSGLVTARADQNYANGSDPIIYGVTIQAYVDSVAGTPESTFEGGEAALAYRVNQGYSRSVTATTVSTATTLVATVGNFFPLDSGCVVTGTGIPASTTFTYVDSTHGTLSQAATASGTVAVALAGK